MSIKRDLASLLYDKNLPQIYRKMDALGKPTPYPLKRFLQVADAGFNYISDKTEGVFNLYDPDTCPPEFIPYLADMVGFEFPEGLPIERQRLYLKNMPDLYKNKGNRRVFNYFGRIAFGPETYVTSARRNWTVTESGVNYVELRVEIDGDTKNINLRTDEFRYFAEQFRPVNHKLNVLIALMYYDQYESAQIEDLDVHKLWDTSTDIYVPTFADTETLFLKGLTETDAYEIAGLTYTATDLIRRDEENDTYDVSPLEREEITILKHVESEDYDKTRLDDEPIKEMLINLEEDAYNGNMLDETFTLSKDCETDIYQVNKLDNSVDTMIILGSMLGNTSDNSVMGRTFITGRGNESIQLNENNI